jgi:hypothetical protein
MTPRIRPTTPQNIGRCLGSRESGAALLSNQLTATQVDLEIFDKLTLDLRQPFVGIFSTFARESSEHRMACVGNPFVDRHPGRSGGQGLKRSSAGRR